MSNKQKPPRPIEEVLASLTHPATMNASPKPYIFVEGTDDIVIYREIVKRVDLSISFPSFEGVGSRTALFLLNDKIQQQIDKIKAQVLFFADRDTSVLSLYFAEFEDKSTLIGYAKNYAP